MKSLVLIVATLGCLAAFDAAAEDERVADLLSNARAGIVEQCAASKRIALESQSGYERATATSSAWMACECMPAHLDRIGTDLSGGNPAATTSRGTMLRRLKAAVSACTAQGIRSGIADSCPKEQTNLDNASHTAYCSCLTARLETVSDDALAQAAEIGKADFDRKVQARIEGRPDPAPTPTVLKEIDATCRSLSSPP
ncbi:MAG TPA: hypothetical protein VKB34_00970 [Povalibacter sp.]|nr:hypothetical protein [Povalibacter sp.]